MLWGEYMQPMPEIPDGELDSDLDFIKQIREVTGSNEPLILAPTPTTGKTQSAKMGSCHWAVQKLVEQHLGRMFNC